MSDTRDTRDPVERLIDALICQHCYRSRPCHCSPAFAAEIRRIGEVRKQILDDYPERRRDFVRNAVKRRKKAA